MPSKERKITLQETSAQGKHNKRSITTRDAESIRVCKENIQQRSAERRKLGEDVQYY